MEPAAFESADQEYTEPRSRKSASHLHGKGTAHDPAPFKAGSFTKRLDLLKNMFIEESLYETEMDTTKERERLHAMGVALPHRAQRALLANNEH